MGVVEYVETLINIYSKDDIQHHINTMNGNGDRPIHLVDLSDRVEVFKAFVELGANPYLMDGEGTNVIHRTYISGQRKVPLSFFFDLGYSPYNVVDVEGNNLLHLGLRLMYERGTTFLIDDLRDNHSDVFSRLLNMPNSKLLTPFMAACSYGLVDVVTSYMTVADVNVRDKEDNTCLHLAANKEVFSLLLAKGLSLDAKNVDNRTPLEVAIDNKRWDIVRYYYLELKKDINEKHYCLLSKELRKEICPLPKLKRWQYLALRGKTKAIVEALKEIGVNTNDVNKFEDYVNDYRRRWEAENPIVIDVDLSGVPLYYYPYDQLVKLNLPNGVMYYTIKDLYNTIKHGGKKLYPLSNTPMTLEDEKSILSLAKNLRGNLGKKLAIASLMEDILDVDDNKIKAWRLIYRLNLSDITINKLLKLSEQQKKNIANVFLVLGLPVKSTLASFSNKAKYLDACLRQVLAKAITNEMLVRQQ
jgi:ankyrin repeat protein